VLVHGGRKRGEAALDEVSLADGVELPRALEHPHWAHAFLLYRSLSTDLLEKEGEI
jgi:hypothetical protein